MTLGSSSTTTFTIAKTVGGVGNLNITSATVSGAPFLKAADTCTGASLTDALSTCTVNIAFSPTAVGPFAGTLSVLTNASNGTTKIASFTGSGVAVGATVTGSITSPPPFGDVAVGSSGTATFTITKDGGVEGLTTTSATVSGAPFLKTADNCTGNTLANVSDACTIEVMFSPTVVGLSVGTLTVLTNATNGSDKIAALTGTGVVTAATVTGGLLPLSFDFGSVPVGSPSTTTFTISRTGGAENLTIADVAVSGLPFLITSDACTGASLTAFGTCDIDVEYNPAVEGFSAGTLTVVTNATDGTDKIAGLSGNGVSGVTVTGSIAPSPVNYGDVTVGSLSTNTFTITNTGGTGNLTIASAAVSGGSFLKTSDACTGASLALGNTCTIDVAFSPTALGASTGMLTVVTNATDGTDKIAALSGNGVSGVTVTGSIAPGSVNYGDVTVGSLSTSPFTITNTGGTGNLTIASATVSAGSFLKTSDACTGASLALGNTCTIDVAFNPTAVGASAATLTVLTNATNGTTKIAGVTGNGVTGATVTGSVAPVSFNFGSVPVGSPSITTFTISRTGGTGNLTIASAAVSGLPFLITSDTCTGASLPALGTCTIDVEYNPTAAGTFAGTLTVVTDATNGNKKIAALNGTSPASPSPSPTSPGTIAFSSAEYAFNENIGTATIFVLRAGGSAGAVTVNYTTADGTASAANGDYVATSSPPNSPLSWEDGDASPKTIAIVIPSHPSTQESKEFSLILSGATGGATLGDASIASVGLVGEGSSTSTGGGCALSSSAIRNPLADVAGMIVILVGLVVWRHRAMRRLTIRHVSRFR